MFIKSDDVAIGSTVCIQSLCVIFMVLMIIIASNQQTSVEFSLVGIALCLLRWLVINSTGFNVEIYLENTMK